MKYRRRIYYSAEQRADTRMSQEAMFGMNPITARGFQDITKAIFQLWRFFSHCRRGYTGKAVDDDAVGVVLTLDNWLVLADSLRKEVLANAEQMSRDKDVEITAEDKRPIVFVAVPELERTLSKATELTFLEALRLSNTEKYWGWRLDGIHNDLVADTSHPKRDYPFADELGKLLPWWNELGEERADRQSG